VRPLLDDRAMLQHDNHVGVTDGAESVDRGNGRVEKPRRSQAGDEFFLRNRAQGSLRL
jgi:hypothetical protein